MNVHTRATVNITYTMVYERAHSDLMTNAHTGVVGCQITMSDLTMNVHTCYSENTSITMLYVISLCRIQR